MPWIIKAGIPARSSSARALRKRKLSPEGTVAGVVNIAAENSEIDLLPDRQPDETA
ncbi:hypothetical protein [Paenibacillus sp. 1P03SA]|uniref:hypothetical protein n=1 Tax=Paenibacillus sp. 1P03SA TaxID=3132294 RepID=UPI00399F8DB8